MSKKILMPKKKHAQPPPHLQIAFGLFSGRELRPFE